VEAVKPKALLPGEAHDLALKAAETDATKRALATFEPFGLYDRELASVKNRKARVYAPDEYYGRWVLSLPKGAGQSFSKAKKTVLTTSRRLERPRITRKFQQSEQDAITI
jgi:hypothetical protein